VIKAPSNIKIMSVAPLLANAILKFNLMNLYPSCLDNFLTSYEEYHEPFTSVTLAFLSFAMFIAITVKAEVEKQYVDMKQYKRCADCCMIKFIVNPSNPSFKPDIIISLTRAD